MTFTKYSRRFTSMLILLGLVSFTLTPSAQAQVDPLGGLALGAGLNIFASNVKEIIEKAVGGGLMLEVQAGGQIGTLIQQANTAYQADLGLTFDRLSAAEQTAVSNIKSLVDQYSKQIYSEMADITKRAQAVANTIPFSKTEPQLVSYGPAYATQSDTPVTLSAEGNFFDLYQEGYDPEAIVNQHSLVASTKTSQHIEFTIPNTDFVTSPSVVTQNSITIRVPYWRRYFLWNGGKLYSKFSIPIAMLTPTVGNIALHTDVAAPGTEVRTFTTGEIDQDSQDDDIKCGGEHSDLAIHTVTPDPGWTVRPSTVHWNKVWTQGAEGTGGDYWLDHNCSTTTTACLCVSTEHHRFGKSGKVHFSISYDAERPATDHAVADITKALSWNDRLDFNLPAGATWTATVTKWDGTTFAFSAAPYNSPLINAYETGDVLSIFTAPQNGQ
jgi:hypothetical protein